MIEVSNIRFSYGRRTAPVFEDFSLSLREASITASWARTAQARVPYYI